MFNLNFTNDYKVVHITNELGSHMIGGAGTYMNELYENRNNQTGFVYMNLGNPTDDLNISDFLDGKDILIINKEESFKLEQIKCDILVVQFYELAFCLTDNLIGDKKIVYVIHSVPTPEPPPEEDFFGGNYDVQNRFEKLCDIADILICVSKAEKKKLIWMYPEYESKIKVIYNGITYSEENNINNNYRTGRKIFGYIGRMDYRKGIMECIKELRDIDGELRIACSKNDDNYLEKILNYIEGANIQKKVRFYSRCVKKRKENFLNSLDALIIPSLYEPFGYVALEAMERGLIVISSNNGGLDEILEGYKYKYDPYKVGELNKIIRQFQEDSNEIIEEQQKILLRNLRRFSAKEMVGEYEKIYAELIEEKNDF